jgi:hypothetical protein
MSLSLIAYRSSAEHDKHVRIVEFCRANGVSLPRETAAYFGDASEGIDPNNLNIEIDDLLRCGEVLLDDGDDRPRGTIQSARIDEEMSVGFELAVSAIPKGATRLRVCWRY